MKYHDYGDKILSDFIIGEIEIMKKKSKKIIFGIIGGIAAAVIIVSLVFVIGDFCYLSRYNANKTTITLAESGTDNIRVMSCNVRCRAIQDLGKKSWYYRAELIAKNLSPCSPISWVSRKSPRSITTILRILCRATTV